MRSKNQLEAWTVMAAVLVSGCGGVNEVDGEAQLASVQEPESFSDYVATAKGAVQIGKWFVDTGTGVVSFAEAVYKIFFGSGDQAPDLVAKLDQIKAQIETDIDATLDRNIYNELIGQAHTAVDNYDQLLQNPAQDQFNRDVRIPMLTSFSGASTGGFWEAISTTIENRPDNPELGYKLGPSLNVIAMMMIHGFALQNHYFPEDAATSWRSYNQILQRTMRVDYLLVGATMYQCWPGFNPVSKTPNGTVGAFTGEEDGVGNLMTSYQNSLFFKKLASKYLAVGYIHRQGDPCEAFCDLYGTIYYNPATKDTNVLFDGSMRPWGYEYPGTPAGQSNWWGHLPGYGVDNPPPDRYLGTGDYYRMYSPAGYLVSDINALAWFRYVFPDPVVKSIRSSMQSILDMTGGDDDLGIDGDPNLGAFVNPTVGEPACAPHEPRAYPTAP